MSSLSTPIVKRSLALDALRGFAILTMLLSGQIPFGVLPSWMYHAQVPPPLHKFVPSLPGITWVDLVFPFFLFALGAAIPLAVSKKIEKQIPWYRIVGSFFSRALLLVGFAIVDQHIRPYQLSSSPTTSIWLLALLGFFLFFPALGRFPWKINSKLNWIIKISGFIGIFLFMFFIKYPDGSGFIALRRDIIILVLANVALTGSLVWYLTRNNILLRIGILAFLFAIRLIHPSLDWGMYLWKTSPAWISWFGMFYFQQYLFIVIPGTIIGDFILKWMNSKDDQSITSSWNAKSLWSILTISLLFIIIILVGLKGRHIAATLFLSAGLGIIISGLMCKPISEIEKLLKQFCNWGFVLLLLGLFFEPYEGGIKKDHPTMSYYFVTSGLACFMLIAFTIFIDIFKKQKWVQILIDNGQNPMIAYAGITNLMPPLLALTGISTFIGSLHLSPWLGVLWAVIVITMLALIVSFFTKKKIFWRT
jgi:predicted acyltransferase